MAAHERGRGQKHKPMPTAIMADKLAEAAGKST